MPTFERFNGGHLAARVRTHDKAEVAAHRRLVEDGVDGWREAKDPKPSRPGKPAVEPLTDAEVKAAVEAKLLDGPDAEHDPAEVRAKLAAK
jgi:hypothetical protein